MEQLIKYPRTPHIQGSRLQAGDEDLADVPFSNISSRHLVIEEKIDGANCGISFDDEGCLRLQSRGHFLTGGYRERHFNLLKTWAGVFTNELYEILGTRYIMYGEWLFAKHTVFYDRLPHYFFEFDILDSEKNIFLSTDKRIEMLRGATFIQSVPILHSGRVKNVEALKAYLTTSLYKSDDWHKSLMEVCKKESLDYEMVLKQTDDSNLAEGLYIKVEEDGIVKERYKFVRSEFVARILSNDSHWLDRPIIPNLLTEGDLQWTY